ncbi:MAG TPA: hypothetical protein VHW42_08030 [Actinomycetes bacterium]|nr:hypothetical protein [Actinomycetes bacterium]
MSGGRRRSASRPGRYSSSMSLDQRLIPVSLATVELKAEAAGGR